MRAGVAIADISPELGVELGGYPYFDRANTGIHDPLLASALYLVDHRNSDVLLLVTDLFWISRPQAERVRRLVSERTGIAEDRVIITCSHTHSAPWMKSMFESFPGQPPFETRVDEDYITGVVETLVTLGAAAQGELFDAEVGYALTTCGAEAGIGGNRRHPETGAADADLPILAVRDSSGAVRAIWTKYALHPTILHGENLLVSADFPGSMRTQVATAFPDAVFMYSMGTAGDQSPRYFRQGQTFDEAERFGTILGNAVVETVDTLHWMDEPPISLASRLVELPVKKYDVPSVLAERVDHARKHEQELIALGAPYTEVQTANMWLLGAECDWSNSLQQADGRLQERYNSCAPYTVHGLLIGNISYVFLPGEIFCDFGLDIKRRSPFVDTHVVTLSNGDLPGYCVTQQALTEGGYEPGNSILDAQSGHILADAAIDILTELTNN
ncbi:neutral/alkaline non-lysosomal ceramidase N-terminal domain-containing protein [Tessaracoccus sp.]